MTRPFSLPESGLCRLRLQFAHPHLEAAGRPPVGRLPGEDGHDVAVDVPRRAHAAVTEQVHHHPRVSGLAEQDGGGRVPAVVRPYVADAGLLEGRGSARVR